MIINKISPNITTPCFNGKRPIKKDDIEKSPKVPALINVSQDKVNNALKAAVLIPAVSLPLVLGSCSDNDECEEYWADGSGTSLKYPSIHVLPEFKVDSLTFANDTVRIPENLSDDSKINKTMNNFIDTLSLPKFNSGNFPAVIAFQTPDFIKYMKLDGLESNDNAYIYDVQQHNSDGSVNIYKSEFTADGDDLIMNNYGTDVYSQYKFSAEPDSVSSYANTNGTYVKDAIYLKNDDKNYPVKQITTEGDTTKISNIIVFSVEAD